VVGIFEVGMYEFDSGLALVNIEDAQKLYRLDALLACGSRLDDLHAAPLVARATMAEDAGIRQVRLDAQSPEFLPRHADRKA
jgi:lipoprotein-releasing system permease protein